MSSHSSPAEIQKHVRVYIGVFAALLVFTFITVGISYINPGRLNIAVALIIALFKATLVAGYFMHLNSEKKTIYRFLIVTVLFFLGLMFLTLLAFRDPVVMNG